MQEGPKHCHLGEGEGDIRLDSRGGDREGRRVWKQERWAVGAGVGWVGATGDMTGGLFVTFSRISTVKMEVKA